MHGVLSWERTHTEKGHILGIYDPERVSALHSQTLGARLIIQEYGMCG
jgi:tRNA-splicing endonuclease subunit Sen54